MDGWPVGRLLSAAQVTGNFVKLRVASLMRGDEPLLYMQVIPGPNAAIDEKSYARWSTRVRGPVPRDWGPRAGSPWRVCRYSGPLRTMTVTDFDHLIDGVSGGGKTIIAGIVELIDAHLDGADLVLKDRRVLLQFFKRDFSAPRVEVLVRPGDSDASCDLSLLSAQEIHQAVATGERLTPAQLTQAEILLKYAPWNLGYWGPFKALVKAVPADELAEAYADAVARLSSTESLVPIPATIDIEYRDELRGWFGIPSKRTQQYLARRARRDLGALAKRSPDTYAHVASRLLTSWDQPLSNYSYAPAFVMLGARSPLDDHSRCVRRPADMAERRDAHPEIWDGRSALAANVFRSIRSSVEALSWACQVLDDAGAPIPELPARSIALALDSTYPPLRRMGCESLPEKPTLFRSLTGSQWTAFFQTASDSEIDQAARRLVGTKLTTRLGEALTALFAQPAQDPAHHAHHVRLAPLYLEAPKAPFTNHSDADVTAVAAAIEASGTEHQELWDPVVTRMEPWNLFETYRALAEKGVSGAGLESIATVLLGRNHHPSELILECLSSTNPEVEQLGWRLVEAHGGRPFLFTQLLPSAGQGLSSDLQSTVRCADRILLRAGQSPEVGQVIQWALASGLDQPTLVALLANHPLWPDAVWELIDAEPYGEAASLASGATDATRAVGDSVAASQLATATPVQLLLILRYITQNPSRIAGDPDFGIRALNAADADLRAEALQQLLAAGHFPRIWLSIAETGLPSGLDAVRQYLQSVEDTDAVRDAVLACLASKTPAVRQIGIDLYRTRDTLAGDPSIVGALGTVEDRLAQDLVADAADAGSPVDDNVLQEFDRRILIDKTSSPHARARVQKRLDALDPATAEAAPERVTALLELARGNRKGDREWALMRLATLALDGLRIDGLEVSLTTDGAVGLEDVAP